MTVTACLQMIGLFKIHELKLMGMSFAHELPGQTCAGAACAVCW